MTPAVGAAAFVLGAGLVWAESALRRRAQEHEDWLNQNRPTDALNRKLDLTRLSNEQLEQLRRRLEGKKDGIYQDPLTNVTVTGADLNTELMRRSGQGGFLFVPPVVAGPAVARLAAGAAGYAGLFAGALAIVKGFFNWGMANSRPGGAPTKAGEKVGAWPIGTYDPAGTNYWSWEAVGVKWDGANGCKQVLGNTATQEIATPKGRLMWLEMKPTEDHFCGGPSFNDGFLWNSGAMGEEGGDSTLGGFLRVANWLPGLALSALVRPANISKGVPFPVKPGTLPDEWTPPWQPEVEPAVKPLPLPIPPATVPLPVVVPEAVPVTEPEESVAVPGTRPAAVPGTLPVTKPSPGGITVLPDGTVPQPKPLPPVTTPGDQIIPWPGAGPIGSPGQSPRPDLVGIAQELGKIEQKLEIMNRLPDPLAGPLDPRDLSGLGKFLWDLMNGMQDAGEYSLWSPCIPSGEPGSSANPMLYPWSWSWSPLGGIDKRLDAIAEMLQDQKVLPQPTCKPPRVEGEWVSVNFESTNPSMQSLSRLRKVFRYRDQQGHDLVAHVEHWRDFTWQAGDVVVIHKGGVWGVPQVWAASTAEGKRVIRHAAAIAGVDLNAPGSEWVVTRSGDPRYGMAGEMRVRRGRNGLWMISKRNGPSGAPEYLIPG